MLDLTAFGPITQCICGSEWFKMFVTFDEDREIAGYLLEAECGNCEAKLIIATPVDIEQNNG